MEETRLAGEYEITGHTRFGGLLGYPVAHSISPQMHNYSFRRLGIDAVYLCFSVQPEQLGETVRTFRNLDCFGFNLTMPDKTAVLEYLDELSPAARMIGAVNTVVNDHGKGVHAAGQEMTLLGAGGAGSAIAVQAALDGVKKLHIANRKSRSFRHAEMLAQVITENTACRADVVDLEDAHAIGEAIDASGILANATSVGMKKPDLPADAENQLPLPDTGCLHEDLVVADVIYNPRQTRLLREAQARGCQTLNGMYMLLYQGAEAFRLWTGQDMPVSEVRQKYFAV